MSDKIKEKTNIVEIGSAEFGREIRADLLEFAQNEIRPLITDLSDKEADEKAFMIALKIFSIHDVRLQGEMTLQAIASMFDITKERVRQIESKATRKLKHPKISRDLLRYLLIGETDETVGF